MANSHNEAGGRRESFARFAANQLLKQESEDPPKAAAPSAEVVRRGNRSFERHTHSAALLGYSMQQSFVALLFLVYLSSLEWTIRNEDGVPVLNSWAMLHGLFVPATTAWTINVWANISQMTHRSAGPKYARVSLLVGVVFVPALAGVLAALFIKGVDTKYASLDLFIWSIWVVLFITIDGIIRNKWAAQDRKAAGVGPRRGVSSTASAGKSGGEGRGGKPARGGGRGGVLQIFLTWIPTISGVVISFVYPVYILPTRV